MDVPEQHGIQSYSIPAKAIEVRAQGTLEHLFQWPWSYILRRPWNQ